VPLVNDASGKRTIPPLIEQQPSMAQLDALVIGGINGSAAIGDALVSVQILRSIQQASQVTIVVFDASKTLINSPLWQQKTVLTLAGHRYVLVKVQKQGRTLSLLFEDAVVNLLRHFTEFSKAYRERITRLVFVRSLCREAGVKFYAPEAGPPAPKTIPNTANASTDVGGQGSFLSGAKITVKRVPASAQQLDWLSQVLAAGVSVGAPERVLVALVMAVTAETVVNNEAKVRDDYGHWHYGLFQQDLAYWTGGKDITRATLEFLKGSAKRQTTLPGVPVFAGGGFLDYYTAHVSEGQTAHGLAEMIKRIQRPGLDADALYGVWYDEAVNTVAAFARSGKHTVGLYDDRLEWQRGLPGKPEDSWTAINRLMGDIGWRVFMVDDTLWTASDEWLAAVQPGATLVEGEGACSRIDWSFDEARAASVNITGDKRLSYDVATAQVDSSWVAAPGFSVAIAGQGVANGRWLIQQWQRTLGRPDGRLDLIRPAQTLGEPVGDQSGKGAPALPRKIGGSPIASHGYVSPFDPSGNGTGPFTFAGVDQGTDWSGAGPIFAIGDATITNVEPQGSGSGWPGGIAGGGALICYQLIGGDHNGRYVYLAENVDPAPGLHAGMVVSAGQKIATARGAYPYLETGWAANPHGGTLAVAHGDHFTNPPHPTPDGADFRDFLTRIGVP
jgi:hypothetical protein